MRRRGGEERRRGEEERREDEEKRRRGEKKRRRGEYEKRGRGEEERRREGEKRRKREEEKKWMERSSVGGRHGPGVDKHLLVANEGSARCDFDDLARDDVTMCFDSLFMSTFKQRSFVNWDDDIDAYFSC
ncbi:hypothetical protein CAPTEDRAFT_208156 [Capitella teleta]|uniref:Uncharacterized protein n=1 Tax=Capitella teleta TaxID=283909 RepID=R7UYD7_CAPTE|nr:hypothetical protein CAPTEDRAFT_208156 [Capitella teleta]|eukprot:ELU11277.1 hypothetical protein CAPTEDRAFT_208156 [Capitella teleta]